MIIRKNVESGSYPEAVKILTDKVLVADNVRQEQRIEEFANVERESITVYIYDVTEYTKDEYISYFSERDRSDIDYIAMMTDVDLEGG